jgi:aminomethyltransferase
MGQVWVRSASGQGDAAAEWLNGLLTNNVKNLEIGAGQYSLLLNEQGGVIDDLIVYRTADDEFFLVVNASRVEEDFTWLQQHHSDSAIELQNASDQYAAIAVQGPNSSDAFRRMISDSVSDAELPARFHLASFATAQGSIIVCRTGYTGEDGFELFCPTANAAYWWQNAINAGAQPAGLGARDILRLEKCYPLNGSDLSPDHTPLEAGLGFAVDLQKSAFIGQQVLLQQKQDGLQRRLVAIQQTEKSPPPRHGYPVIAADQRIGELSSGAVSPTLGTGIGMAYLPAEFCKAGTVVATEIRGRQFAAEVVKKPFL